MGSYFPCRSTTITNETASLDADKYIWSVSPGIGLDSVGSLCNAFFIWCSAASTFGVQQKLFFSMHPLRVSNSGIAFSADLEMKQVSIFSLPLRPWTSLSMWGDVTSLRSVIVVGIG